jgi:hypothetical protein
MEQESLEFSVTVSGTYWSKKPQFSIWLDDKVIIQTEISSDAPQTHKFNHILDEGEHTLKIKLENKTDSDILKDNYEDSSNYKIISDMILNILDITIDDISIGELIWDSVFVPDKPQQYQGKEISQLDGCVNLGWNGTYILKFSSPYYIWLLEKL